jgi:hypothetical protein
MDYNDISQRLKKTLKSLNGRYDDDIAVYVTHKLENETEQITFKVGNLDEEEMINKIFIIFYNLASLKDNIKNCLEKKGLDKNLIEVEINNSIHLQVLIDIVNQEKHGYPLKKTNRSGKNPLIKNIFEVINLQTSTTGSVASLSLNQNEINIQGNARTVIRATIYDDKNNVLFSLDELITNCFERLENFIKRHNCS